MSQTPGTIGPLERLNSFINESPTIWEKAGAQIDAPAHKAVMYDDDGNVVLATGGDEAIGIILSSSPDPIPKGAAVNILISCIGLLEAGGAIKKGARVTINAAGQGIVAGEDDAYFARAFTASAEAGELIQVQI